MINIRNQGANGFEVEVLFRSILQDEEIFEIEKLLKILGKFGIVDKKIIDTRLKNPMKLKYIVKAVRCRLINQFHQAATNQYFFTLAPGGIYFLQSIKYTSLNLLPLNTSHYDKQKLLTFNYWASENHFDLLSMQPGYNWYICKNKKDSRNSVCYFKFINVDEIKQRISENNIDEDFNFNLIDKELVTYTSRSIINKNTQSLSELEMYDSLGEDVSQLD